MSKIKQSLAWWCFVSDKLSPAQFVRAAAEMGYSGIDLVPPEYWSLVKSHGLTISSYGAHKSLTLGLNRRDQHDSIEKEVLANLAAAEKWGIPNLICFSGNRDGLSDTEGAEITAAGLARLAPAAEAAGVTLVLELLNSKVDHPGYQADHTAWGVQVCQMVASPLVKLLYDIYHMQIMEGDIIRTIRSASPFIGHYHTAGNPGRSDMDDTQEINYPPIYSAIAETGYSGFIAHEFVPKADPLAAMKSTFAICAAALGGKENTPLKPTQRSYLGPTDQAAMFELAHAYPSSHLRVADLPYRLSSWALDDAENVGLWTDTQGHLSGWAVLQTPWWTIDFTCRPEDEAVLLPEMLAWADRRARAVLDSRFGCPTWFALAFSDQVEHIRFLEQAGFASQADVGENSWTKVLMRRPAELPVAQYRIPAGFSVRPLAGAGEVPAYVDLHQAVFESKNMTLEWRRRTLLQPDYQPDLDLVIEAPDGRLAAFCICWICKDTAGHLVGQVEPLGCHSDFRRYALGRVALAEGLRRLQAQGVAYIQVETDNYRETAFRLYENVGFQVTRDVLVFRKDYEKS
jgi:hydroxypyruvate isomerase